MNESRREFIGISADAAAALAVLVSAAAVEVTDKAIGPIMYEHVCDHGKSRYSPEDLAEMEAYYQDKNLPPRQWGCGTRFRWWFGVPIFCHKCGWCYESTLEVLNSGIYKKISG